MVERLPTPVCTLGDALQLIRGKVEKQTRPPFSRAVAQPGGSDRVFSDLVFLDTERFSDVIKVEPKVMQ